MAKPGAISCGSAVPKKIRVGNEYSDANGKTVETDTIHGNGLANSPSGSKRPPKMFISVCHNSKKPPGSVIQKAESPSRNLILSWV